MIQLEHLTKNFGSLRVLEDISVVFETGIAYGIAGENGSGKTTLFKCIAGLEPFEGLVGPDRTQLKNQIGYLPTEPFFFPRITGLEYIRLMCLARRKTMENPDLWNLFQLPLNQYASTYSTGMKKKLALTAILLQGNQYFILDEPFNGVDIQSNLLIAAILKRLKESGKTLIISSHIFSTLGDLCDEIFLLKERKIFRKANKGQFSQLEKEMMGNAEASIPDFIIHGIRE